MKTIAAIDALAKHFEQRVRDINADTKEKYTEELNKARSEYGELVQRISDFDPIMLPVYTDKPEQMIKKIAERAATRKQLPPVCFGTYDACIERTCLEIPKYVDFSQTPHIVISYNTNQTMHIATMAMEHILMTLLLAMPRGKVRLHFIDLGYSGMAQYFIDNLGTLCDIHIDTDSVNNLIVKLQKKAASILKGEAKDEVYDFVVVLDFPSGLDAISDSWRTLVEHGVNSHVHFFILSNYNKNFKQNDAYNPLNENYELFQPVDGDTCIESAEYDTHYAFMRFNHENHPNILCKCVDYINGAIEQESEKVEIDESAYAETSSAIEAPIGKTSTGDVVNFKMDVNRGHYHAFVIGETGSGKSRFLHDIIINMISRYSPDDVELYLMDFKGVEFNPYRAIKHSRVILVDRADERITYEVIRELKQKMEKRQKILAAARASDVDEYNKMSADSHISQIILVADECQTLFSDDAKNNKLQRDMIATIALIAQQGRAYGVHLLLATQSLSNAPQLGASILNQIGEHYILPCLPADAQKLVPDHERKDTETVVSQMEKGKGQCYYQGADGKFLFTFSYIPKGEVQDSLIDAAKKKSDEHNSNGQVYFSGSLQYAMDEQTIDVIAAKGRRHIVASPGQSIAIPQSPVTIPLRDESGENIMLLGINDKQYVTRTSINTLVSMIATNRRKELDYEFVVMDCMKCDDDEPYMDVLDKLQAESLCRLVGARDRKALLYQLCKDIASGSARPTMLTILGEETFRELKFDEPLEFAEDNNSNPTKDEATMSYDDALSMMNMLGNPVTSKPQTDSGISDIKTMMQALEYILDHGPENGVHTIMQLDRIGNFYITKDGYVNSKAVYSRFAHLLILRSGENDVSTLTLPDDIRPAVLEDNGERLRAYYYNEGSNRYELFTPYLMPKTELIDKLLK